MATAIPTNQATFSLQEIARITGADVQQPHLSTCGGATGDLAIHGVSTDSRAVLDGKLFIALSGDRFDGHDFLRDAIAHGAAAVLVEREGFEALPVPAL